MNISRKHSLLRLIVNAGLEEEFIEWLKQHGYKDLYGRLDDIPIEIIEKFVNDKKLFYEEDVDKELLIEINNLNYYDEIDKKQKNRK
ncbi:MAG: hypothetical protein QXX35_03385 [Desulfurococcaceae archaeon]|uniref:Uncharacterized protein n=1 Tax=Staphylothermus marinus TaxID=2280 RepID=A0A7C4D7B6_STAMA